MDTIRIYGKRVRTWTNDDGTVEQIEVRYTDYRLNGDVAGTGTEDFSPLRWRSVGHKTVHTWHGGYRKDGTKSWDFDGHVYYRRVGVTYADLVRVLEKVMVPGAWQTELRCC